MTVAPDLFELLQTNWGYSCFRPLQSEAVAAVLGERDSLVILPTGGGKSLCFQLPALAMDGMAVVVSPLISLMKDQVDQLLSRGIEAACLNSSLSQEEKREVDYRLRTGRLKLLYAAPERLLNGSFLEYLKQHPISFFAIDEAHCISQWGHDFRPEYRLLKRLREVFPGVALHAYTATATQQVRRDIVEQLELQDPEVLVGSFDRPNLHYSVSRANRKKEKLAELFDLVDRHKGESGIVYCISRKNVEELAATLNDNGYRALPYHAGMEDGARKQAQEAFLKEEVDIIVATVAFGMGIDKTNVRYVVHWGIPKSVEHYQQESGRAGRDSLVSDCLLFFSAGDLSTWRHLMSAQEGEARLIALKQLEKVEGYAQTTGCRHRFLVEYFGQAFEKEGCGACDLCLGDQAPLPDSLVTSQKILSCVIRVGERFGLRYVANVLAGSEDAKLLANGHRELSTYGLLRESSLAEVETWIAQLVDQEMLVREPEFRTLSVTPLGREALQGKRTPRLFAVERKPRRSRSDVSWEGVDSGLFAQLKDLRTSIAKKEGVPPYVVFSDATLRDLARKRPSQRDGFLEVEGVGKKKMELYSEVFLETIQDYCREAGLERDVYETSLRPTRAIRVALSPIKKQAFAMFAEGADVETVASQLERAPSTTHEYLAEFIEREKVLDPAPWVKGDLHARIAKAAQNVGIERLRPIFEHLNEEVPYEQIRISVACLKNRQGSAGEVPSGGEIQPSTEKVTLR